MKKIYSVAIRGEGFRGVIAVKADDVEEAIAKVREIHWYDSATKFEFVSFFDKAEMKKDLFNEDFEEGEEA